MAEKKKKKKYIFIAVAVVIILVIVIFFSTRKATIEYVTATVTKGQLLQTVSETGTVKASDEINLNFINNGKLGKLYVKIGDKVKKDQLLAELDFQSFSIKEKEAEASVRVAQVNLAKLISGATPQDIAVSERNVDQAKSAYNSATIDQENADKTVAENMAQAQKKLNDLENKTDLDITSYEQAVSVAQTNYDNAKKTYQAAVDNALDSELIALSDKISVCNTALDNINKIFVDRDAELVFSLKNLTYLNNSKGFYNEGVILLNTAKASIDKAKVDNLIVGTANNDLVKALNKTLDALNNTYKGLENSDTTSQFTQADLDAYKLAISTQTTYVNAAISSLQTTQHGLDNAKLAYNTNVSAAQANLIQSQANLDDAINTAKNNLSSTRVNGINSLAQAQARIDSTFRAWELAKAQLNKVQAGATANDIALTQAQVQQAQASLDLAKKQINDSQIKAPIDGTISKSNYEVGEDVGPNKAVFSLLGENNLVVEIDISEADINKVSVNDPVEITLDSFGDDVKFFGYVFFIEPAETVIQEVTYYKVKITFDKDTLTKIKDEGKLIKSGMTANSIITTMKKDNAIVAPSRAVLDQNGKKIVRVLKDKNKVTEVEVATGLQGDGGQLEIISGLKEGDLVVTSTKTK